MCLGREREGEGRKEMLCVFEEGRGRCLRWGGGERGRYLR